jgi:predicted nucleic acid-binding protein
MLSSFRGIIPVQLYVGDAQVDIIVDASVILAVVMNEPAKPALIAETTGATLLAPGSMHWEVGNALSAMLKRRRIVLAQAQQALQAYQAIPIQLLDVDLEQALRLADQLAIYAYDAYLISSALRHGCPLITLDHGLRHAARSVGARLIEVTP